MELYTDNLLISRTVFPIVKNLANGSLVVPGRPGQYWLRAYTFNSRFFVTPISVLQDSKTIITRQFPPQPGLVRDLPVMIKDSGPDSLAIDIADSSIQNLSLSISDPSLPDPGFILLPSNTHFDHPETEQLTFSGTIHANDRKHKIVKNEDLVVIFEKDSIYKLMTCPVDTNGYFRITNLNFTDTGCVNFEINSVSDDKPEVSITPDSKDYPAFVPPSGFRSDTVQYVYKSKPKGSAAFTDSGKYMTPVIVHARWADRNILLDHKYAKGFFSGFTHYNFDLRDTNRTKRCWDLEDFLKKNVPGFGSLGEYNVYLNEVKVMEPEYLNNLDIRNDFAYAKIIEDMSDKPILAIYHKQGLDARTIPGKLNRMYVNGYAKAAPFTGSDRITALWIPGQKGTSFTIKKHPGKLVIRGIDQKGMPVYYSAQIK